MKKIHVVLLLSLLLTVVGLIGRFFFDKSVPAMSYPDFVVAVENGQIRKVYYTPANDTFKATAANGIDYSVPNPKSDTFIETLLTHNIEVASDNGSLEYWRTGIFLILLFGALWYYYRTKKGGGDVKSETKKKENSSVTLKNVAGNTEAKAMVQDIIQFIKHPEIYSATGARMPKGLLFYGPPGTGKTLMAKAIAGEANVPFYTMSGSDFVQMYVGVGASRVRSLFQKAKRNERAIIFIDEIDAIGKKRARNASSGNDERDQTLNALLTEMSGFRENAGIVVIGATNRLDTLDDALLRPGRFDRQIEIGLPDLNARKQIIGLHSNSKPFSPDVDFEQLARSTVFFSGAMIENLINEAAISAANDRQPMIGKSHMDKAFYTVIAGSPKEDRSCITDRDKKVTAYHEAGHALATTLLQPDHIISKVTIIPSVKGAGGFNLSTPKDSMFQTKKQLIASILVLMAGRAAEELTFGEEEVTTGASNDILRVSSLVADLIDKYGMDAESGLFSSAVIDERNGRLIDRSRELSKAFYQTVLSLLKEHRHRLNAIAENLLLYESLNGDEINKICAELEKSAELSTP